MAKLGRVIIPLIFRRGKGKVRVRTLDELRNYFKAEYLEELSQYQKDGKL